MPLLHEIWVCCKETIYGKRDGVLSGLAIIYNDKKHYCRTTKGWRQGVVHQVQMMGRQDMYKPAETWLSSLSNQVSSILFNPLESANSAHHRFHQFPLPST